MRCSSREPDHEIVRAYKRFELRRYVPRVVAETTVRGDFRELGNKAPGDDGTHAVSFIVPSRFSPETLPEPTDPLVRRRVEAGPVAAHRYPGTRSRERWRERALLEAARE